MKIKRHRTHDLVVSMRSPSMFYAVREKLDRDLAGCVRLCTLAREPAALRGQYTAEGVALAWADMRGIGTEQITPKDFGKLRRAIVFDADRLAGTVSRLQAAGVKIIQYGELYPFKYWRSHTKDKST